MSDPIDSNYFKIYKALNDCKCWGQRLEVAFIVHEIEDTLLNRVIVTNSVVDNIVCQLDGGVNSNNVTDEQIDLSIQELVV